ncbi:MAG TPA: hypothetical protein VG432_12700 [Gemmatimonadaceae bacterium]|nr:hypothetical protein [Gemmatimonadaceae bacterium]
MSFLRRSFAALCTLFLLQLSLPGSGAGCAMQGRGGPAAPAHGMDGTSRMRSAAANRGAMPAMPDATAAASAAGCGGMGSHDGCGLPCVPGQCAPMAGCAINAMPAVRGAASVNLRGLRVESPAPALLRSGPAAPPELPPPRA